MKQKIYKLLSIVLTLSLVFTCCMVAFNATAEETKEPITYYVSPEGVDADDRGLEPGTPLASVDKAVNLAKGLGFGAGETVNVKVIYVEGKSAYFGTAESNDYTAHDFTLNISSNDSANLASIGVTNKGFTVSGPLKVENIKLNLGQNNWGAFAIGNNDFYVGKNVTMVGGSSYDFALGRDYNDPFTKDMTIYFGSKIKDLTQGGYNMPLYSNITTIIYDNASSNSFSFVTSQGRTTQYNGTLNFVLNDTGSFSLSTVSGKGGKYSFGVGKAVQIINNNGKSDITSAITCLDGMTDKEGGKLPYYVYTNGTSAANPMETTDTVGKIKVNLDASKYTNIRLVNDDESVVATPDSEGYITVTEPGEYTFKASKVATYYVKPDADSSVATGELDKPFKTVNAAITAVESSYTTGDIVNLKLIKVTTTAEDDTVSEVKNMWFDDYAAGYTASYDFKLNISSNSDTDKATLYAVAGNIGHSGDVVFENVILGFDPSATSYFNFRYNSVSFGKGVEFVDATNLGMMLSWGSSKVKDLDYYFEALPVDLYFGGRWSDPLFGNINVTVNSSNLSRTFYIGDNGDSDAITTFDGIYNLNIKDVASLAFKNGKGTLVFTENFAVQLINSSGVNTISSDAATYFSTKKVTNNGTATDTIVPYYIIDNFYGDNAIEFTETVGKYKINLNPADYKYIGLVNNADQLVEAEPDEDGYIIVPEPGSYTLKAIKATNTTYFVSAGGSDENDGLTADTALASVAKAVEKANAKGLNKNDTVDIKATGTITWGTLPAYDYTLNIESLDSTSKASVAIGTVTGDLAFDNINITNTSYITILGNSIKLGENVSLSSSAIIQLADGTTSLTYPKPVNVIINNAFSGTIHMGNNGQISPTYAEDVNIIVNNSNASPSVTFTTHWGSTKTFKKNLNFIFNKVKAVKFTSPTANGGGNSGTATNKAVVNGAVQIVVPEGVTVTGKDLIDTWITNNSYKLYYVEKASSVAATLSQSATAGKYWVNIDENVYKDVQLVSKADENVVSPLTDGCVAAEATGEYVFTATKIPNAVGTYYVSPNGNDANSGKTVDKPLSSVNGVIAAANAAGYGAGDKVYAKLIKTVGVDSKEINQNWFSVLNPADDTGNLISYNYTLNISSNGDKATIGMLKLSLSGDTEFENVQLAWTGWSTTNLKANNVAFGPNVTYSAAYMSSEFFTSWVAVIPDEFNLYFESMPNYLFLGGYDSESTFKNINITLADKVAGKFKFGDRSDTGETTYDGNLNFNIKGAASFELADGYGTIKFTNNFAAQFINSTGNASLTDSAVEYLKGKPIDGTEKAVPCYVINNITNDKDLIGFTSTAGTYTINGLADGEKLCVYNEVTNELITTDAETFTVDAGEYTVWVQNDSNADIDVDIRDLVYASENIGATDANIIKRADIDENGAVEQADVEKLCKILLGILA